MNIVNIQIPKAFVLIVISDPNDILFRRVIAQKNTKDIRMRGTEAFNVDFVFGCHSSTSIQYFSK